MELVFVSFFVLLCLSSNFPQDINVVFLVPECVELFDALSMKAINNHGMATRKWLEKDSLFFKFQGPSNASLKETATTVQEIVEKHGGCGFTLARNKKEARELWMDRKNLFHSKLAFFKGRRAVTTDVWCVILVQVLISPCRPAKLTVVIVYMQCSGVQTP